MSLPTSAIFSPTAARLAASTSKDWNTIDSWLHRHFRGRPIPKFERNPETLKILLALSTFNDAADEERDLLFAVEKEALQALKQHEKAQRQYAEAAAELALSNKEVEISFDRQGWPDPESTSAGLTLESVSTAILDALEASLPRDGKTALDALAQTSLSLSPPPPDPDPVVLATRLTALQSDLQTLEQQSLRLQILLSYLSLETSHAEDMLAELKSPGAGAGISRGGLDDNDGHDGHDGHEPLSPTEDGSISTSSKNASNPYLPPPGLAKLNLDTQRLIKKLGDSLPSITTSTTVSSHDPNPVSSPHRHHHQHATILQIQELETSFKELLSRKRSLENEVGMFEGLPTDVDAAKLELDGRRRELAKITVKRDVVFEGLVERESPMKRRW